MSGDVGLTEAEREALHEGVCAMHRDTSPGVWVCGPCERAGDAAVERIVADRVREAEQRGAVQALDGIRTHNGTPVTAENLRYAATHEALCRSWIFDVLTGLADRLAGDQ